MSSSPTLYDDEYNGPRWRYGLQYRPLAAGAPKGFIIFSNRVSRDPRCKTFGTIEYPFPLDGATVEQMQLVDFGQVAD